MTWSFDPWPLKSIGVDRSLLVLRFRRFFPLEFVFLLYRFRFISLDFVFLLYRFRFISLDFVSYFTDFVSFRWISFSYFTDFVGFCFRFVSFRFSVYRYPFEPTALKAQRLFSEGVSKVSPQQRTRVQKHKMIFKCMVMISIK